MIDFVNRNTPKIADSFEFELCESKNGLDFYRIYTRDKKIVISGSNKIAMAMGYYRYLHEYCSVMIVNGDYDISFVKNAPLPEKEISFTVKQKIRMAMTYERYAVQADAWGVDRWTKEIDFMAMMGVNTPITLVGSDAVLYKMLEDMRVKKDTAISYISGGSFWYRQLMGNLLGYLPLNSTEYLEKKLNIGRFVTQREKELDMSPVHQGFLLTVPFSFRKHYPKAKLIKLPTWNSFPPAMTIDPNDKGYIELFNKLFLEKQRELLGEVHNYIFDPLNDVDFKGYTTFIEKAGRAFLEYLEEFDSEGVWYVHSRNLVSADFKADNIVIIDEYGDEYDKNHGYNGHKFVVGIKGNLYGRTVVCGDMESAAANPYIIAKDKYENAIGAGIFFDSDYENLPYYSLCNTMLTNDDKAELKEYLKKYSLYRYGTEAYTDTLMKIQRLCYSAGSPINQASALCARPGGDIEHTAPFDTFERPYKNSELYSAVKEAIENDEKKNDNFRNDFAVFLRQVMSNSLRPLYFKVNESFFNQRVQDFENATNMFIEIGEATDRLLKTREEPNLFYHIERSRLLGDTKELQQSMEVNFLMYHTIYGPVKNTVYYDNYWREWGGMTADFYLKRWHLCFRMMAAYFKTPKKLKYTSKKRINGRNEFSDTLLAKRLEYFEGEFIKDYIPRHTGIGEEDTVAVMRDIIDKFDSILKE